MRTALITGGASGIGAAAADRLRKAGISVITADLDPSADVLLDVTSPESLNAASDVLQEADIVVNSAGVVGPNVPLVDVPDDDWERTLAVNLTGVFRVCKMVAPAMAERGWGRIINVASVAGKEGNPNLSAYSASKAGVIGLTKAFGKELATSGVLVNAIAPAVIRTTMTAATAPVVLDQLIAKIPMQRLGTAEEVAELIAWLSSDQCSFSTGAVYDISGGRATY